VCKSNDPIIVVGSWSEARASGNKESLVKRTAGNGSAVIWATTKRGQKNRFSREPVKETLLTGKIINNMGFVLNYVII